MEILHRSGHEGPRDKCFKDLKPGEEFYLRHGPRPSVKLLKLAYRNDAADVRNGVVLEIKPEALATPVVKGVEVHIRLSKEEWDTAVLFTTKRSGFLRDLLKTITSKEVKK